MDGQAARAVNQNLVYLPVQSLSVRAFFNNNSGSKQTGSEAKQHKVNRGSSKLFRSKCRLAYD